MEKVIKIDLVKADDFYERYNKKNISNNLINYLIESTPKLKKDDKLQVVINNKIKISNCKELVIAGLEKEYSKASLKNQLNNYTQIFYLIIGVVIIFISSLIDIKLLEEIVLIGGWVFIWDMFELEIITDMNNRKRRRIIKWLLNSEIIEKN